MTNTTNNVSTKKGFTMIELIFVIVIIGILAAVAVPRLAATRDDAKMAICMNDAGRFIPEISQYYTSQGSLAKISQMTNYATGVTGKTNGFGADTPFATNNKSATYKCDGDSMLTFKNSVDSNGTLVIEVERVTTTLANNADKAAYALVEQGVAGAKGSPKTYTLGGNKIVF